MKSNFKSIVILCNAPLFKKNKNKKYFKINKFILSINKFFTSFKNSTTRIQWRIQGVVDLSQVILGL